MMGVVMKKVLLLALIGWSVVFSISVSAKSPVSDEEHEQNCRNLMGIAENIMTAKQNGIPLSKLLDINNQVLKKNPNEKALHDITNKVIRDAYKQPSYSTPSIKLEQLNEFSAKYYLSCMEMYD